MEGSEAEKEGWEREKEGWGEGIDRGRRAERGRETGSKREGREGKRGHLMVILHSTASTAVVQG